MNDAQRLLAHDAGTFPGEVSVIVRQVSPSSATLLQHNADAVLPTASSAKIALLVAVAQAIESGALDPNEQLQRDSAPFVRDSGIWWHLDQPLLSIADAAKLVGTLSDNLATNVLLERFGGHAAVQAAADAYGMRGFALHDFVRDERLPEHPPTLSTGSARAYADAMALLIDRLLDGEPIAAQVIRWMKDSADLSLVGSAFGFDPLAHGDFDRGMVLVNKTGTDSGIRADSGFVMNETTAVAYSCLINWQVVDPENDPIRDRALDLMREVGRFIRSQL